MGYYFECRGKADVRALTEMRYRIGMKKVWIWIGIYLVTGFMSVSHYRHGDGSWFAPAILFGYAIFLLLNPYFRIRKSIKEKIAFHNGEMPENTIRFGENIQHENVRESLSWEYGHLMKVYSLKYSYCLYFSDDVILMLGREEFTKGTFEEFKKFLREKRPDLDIPD